MRVGNFSPALKLRRRRVERRVNSADGWTRPQRAVTLRDMTQFFHASRHYRKIGEVIIPGHFGRMINISRASHFHFAQEEILERVRQSRYGNKPSRLESIFGCPTEEGVRLYVNEHISRNPSRIREPLYEVETVDLNPAMHRGDWNLVERAACGGPAAEAIADMYWRGLDASHQLKGLCAYEEIITTSPVKITRILG